MNTGSNNVTIPLAIQGDDEPEIDEQFQVALNFVTQPNQRISSSDVSTNLLYVVSTDM